LQGTQQWTTAYTTDSTYEIDGLTPASLYEYRIVPLCSTTTTFIPTTAMNFKTTSLNDVFLKLYPNPVAQSAKLEIVVDKPSAIQIDIYNKLGQKVMNVSPAENLPEGQVLKTINVLKLSSGMYHIVVSINNKLYTLNMIVQH
jgi:hypothetical protein